MISQTEGGGVGVNLKARAPTYYCGYFSPKYCMIYKMGLEWGGGGGGGTSLVSPLNPPMVI